MHSNCAKSPADVLAVDEVPLERLQVEYMQVERVRLDTVQLAIASLLRLPLVEVRLGARLAIQLLDLVRVHIEQVAVVCLLVARCETTKNDHVVLRYLEQATAF